MNIAILKGRLTATPELKKTTGGHSVTSFTVAVDDGYGEKKTTDFINCTAWRGTAEFLCKYFSKGDAVALSGKIKTRKYTDKDGNNRTAFEVVANDVEFCSTKNTGSEAEKDAGVNDADFTHSFAVSDDDLPF